MGSKAGGDECHLAASNADAHGWARQNTSGCIGIGTVFYKHVGGGGVKVDRVQWRRQAEAWARVPRLQMARSEGAGARDDVAVLHDALYRVDTHDLPSVGNEGPRRRHAGHVFCVFGL